MQCTTGPNQLLTRTAVRPCLCFTTHLHARTRRSRTDGQHYRSSTVLVRASPDTQRKQAVDMTIEDLPDDYCTDFECTSSPAVEQTVRQLARDITKFKFNTNFFQPDVTYNDGFFNFKGSERYRQPFWARESLTNPRAVITKMRMLNNGKAEIQWTLSGKLSTFEVSIPVTSVFELNLVTGRVTGHTESWDLGSLSPPATSAVMGSRVIWSAKAASKQARDAISSKVVESLQSLTSMDEDEYYMNPNDPTRFFQKQDNQMNDAIMLCLAVAALYLVFKVFEQIESL